MDPRLEPAPAAGGPGHARRLATGSVAQQLSQVAGLLAMLAIVTVLARRLRLPEFGLYGVLSSLAGYLFVVQNAAAGAVVRQLAAADGEDARARSYSSAAALYAVAGVAAGALVALAGVALASALDLSGAVRADGRLGALLLGAVTALGWPLTLLRDALRARQLFVRVALAEVAAVTAFAGLVLGLSFAGAGLAALIAASGALPALVGCFAWTLGRGAPGGFRAQRSRVHRGEARALLSLGGQLSVAESAAPAIYTLDRVVLGALDSAAAVGLYEGPVRAHNLVRALNAAVTTTALPAASRFVSERDDARLRELVLRGLRYSLALVVPLAVTGMVLAAPLLDVWLGDEFRSGGGAMAILFAYWLVYGVSGVAAAVLVAAGRAGQVARYALGTVAANALLALTLVPPFGIEGVALATTLPYAVVSLLLLRVLLEAAPVGSGELLREALVPAWLVGAALAAALGALRLLVELDQLLPVLVLAAAGPLAAWAAFYGLWLRPAERRLVRSLLRPGT